MTRAPTKRGEVVLCDQAGDQTLSNRVREHLTEAELDKLLASLKRNRHGYRDWLIGLMIYRHGLRVSEACDLRWEISISLPDIGHQC